MIVLKVIGIIIAIIIAIVLFAVAFFLFVVWVSLPIDLRDYFDQQNDLIKDLTEEVKRLHETISKSQE